MKDERALLPEVLLVLGGGEMVEGGMDQAGAAFTCGLLARFQFIAERQQFLHLGHDALLFGRRGDGNPALPEFRVADRWIRDALYLRRHVVLKRTASQPMEQKPCVKNRLWVQDSESCADDGGWVKLLVNHRNVAKIGPDCGVDDRPGSNELACP